MKVPEYVGMYLNYPDGLPYAWRAAHDWLYDNWYDKHLATLDELSQVLRMNDKRKRWFWLLVMAERGEIPVSLQQAMPGLLESKVPPMSRALDRIKELEEFLTRIGDTKTDDAELQRIGISSRIKRLAAEASVQEAEQTQDDEDDEDLDVTVYDDEDEVHEQLIQDGVRARLARDLDAAKAKKMKQRRRRP